MVQSQPKAVGLKAFGLSSESTVKVKEPRCGVQCSLQLQLYPSPLRKKGAAPWVALSSPPATFIASSLLDRAAHSQGGCFPSVAVPLANGLYKHLPDTPRSVLYRLSMFLGPFKSVIKINHHNTSLWF